MSDAATPSLAWLLHTPFAHRGLHGAPEAPENSLPAFERALRAGYGIELDLRVTRDRQVVVFHDQDLQRCCGIDSRIADLTLDELRPVRLFGTDAAIPTFREFLDLVRGQVPILIELKRESGSPAYEDLVLQELQGYSGPFAIQSFNPYTVRWLKRNAPGIIAGILSGRFSGGELPLHQRIALRYLLALPWVKPDFIAYEQEEAPEILLSLIRRLTGLPLLFWTIRSEEALKRARTFGAGMVFEGITP